MRSIGRASVVIATLVALLLTALLPSVIDARSGHAANSYKAGRYIVTFADAPAAEYNGYQAGFAATAPKPGHKFDKTTPAVANWQRHLTNVHNAALTKAGVDVLTKLYDYTVANNGVAVRLSAQQAQKLAAMPGVVGLERDQLAKPDTTDSPHFLGLDAAGGLWSQLGGGANAGAGIVVGVIDTGIWPEDPSFAALKDHAAAQGLARRVRRPARIPFHLLQQQAHRRPLLPRRLRQEVHRQVRLPLAA